MDILTKIKNFFKTTPKQKLLPPPETPVLDVVRMPDLNELRRLRLQKKYKAAFEAVQKTDSELLN